jgi:hypothetical protein
MLASVSATTGPAAGAPGLLEAAHVPPVLTLPGEPITLRYALVCAPREDGRPCQGSGVVHVRAGQAGSFRPLTLERGDESKEGRYFVDLPGDIATSPEGFSYYAVLRDDAGASVTVPSGGAAAPQRSFPVRQAVAVDLGAHTFGRLRARDATVLEAEWGSAVGEVGLAGSRQLGYVGPASFDVGRDGRLTVLDQVNRRVQRWIDGRATTTPLAIRQGLADFAVEPDGTMHVLEPADRAHPGPVLRSFHSDGTPKWAERLSDRTWAKLELGPDGPVVQQQPSEQWLPVAAGGTPLDRSSQARRGRPGLPYAQGRELVVQRVGDDELRLAELAGNAIARAWRVRTATPLGEIQLAAPLGSRIVTVVKTYTDEKDEFLVLVLGRAGLEQRFALEPVQWAESAPLARFRLAGSSLYRLGSSPTGAFVDRFDLEVSG